MEERTKIKSEKKQDFLFYIISIKMLFFYICTIPKIQSSSSHQHTFILGISKSKLSSGFEHTSYKVEGLLYETH